MSQVQPLGRLPGVAGFYPWGRYWAKMIDAFLGGVVVGMIFGRFTQNNSVGLFLAVTALFPAMEGALIAWLGTTPGKALFRISVLDGSGERLPIGRSIKRSYDAWIQGAFVGIPIASLYGMMKAYEVYKRDGVTPWDRNYGARFISSRPTLASWVSLILLVAAYVALVGLGAASRPS